jgi:hypothetical protein
MMRQVECSQNQLPVDHGLSLAARVAEQPRDVQLVALTMVDGTRIRGLLHRAPGTRTLDYLNRQAETFVAVTDATVANGETSEQVLFVAINKSHIVQVIEAEAED